MGLDEAEAFSACGVGDVKAIQQGVASLARSAVEPLVQITTEVESFEGAQLVVVHVVEADPAAKPIRVRATGKAYLRQYDGTYELSSLEEQAFVAARTPQQYDRSLVPSSCRDDLDDFAVASFVRTRRSQSSVFGGWSDERILAQAGVMGTSGETTLAGLLALGQYPQGYYPNLAIQAAAWSGRVRGGMSTVLDSVVLEGPIPAMLEDAEAWVARNSARGIMERDDGNLHDSPEYPGRAVRELVANALIHRDLGPYSLRQYVSLTLEPGRLTITSPGGLFGLTVDALGQTDSSLRNGTLAAILMSVRSASGDRVIERLGSGIPAARDAMRLANLPEPQFFDTGLSFTARLTSRRGTPVMSSWTRELPALPRLTDTQRSTLRAVISQPGTVGVLVEHTDLTARQVRRALSQLVGMGLVASDGAARNAVYGPTPKLNLLEQARLGN